MPFFRESRFNDEKGIQGAIVEIYKTGLIRKIKKVDFSAFYPSIVMSFNLSPETTKIKEYLPYTNKYDFDIQKDRTLLYIPDNRINKTVVIEINNTIQGFLPAKLIEFKEKRDKIKLRLREKNLTPGEQVYLNSLSWTYKILSNSVGYGINKNAWFKYGDLSISIAITGLARYFIQFVMDLNLDKNIEVDTDGIYVDGDINIDDVNYKIKEHTLDKFNIPFVKNYLFLELDEYDAGFFYKTKNYLLFNNGKVIKHGVTFLSSSKTILFKKALDKIAEYIFNNKSVIEAVNILINEESTLKDFTMKTNINQPISEYKNDGCLQKQLAKQVKEHLKQDLQVSDTIDYIKTKDGYKILTIAKLHEVDKRYYYDQLQTLINIFTDEKISIENGGAVIQKKLEGY